MTHLVIVDSTSDNKIAKMQNYENRADADAHVAMVAEKYPKAFVVDNPPAFGIDYVTVDMDAKTFVYDNVRYDAEQIKTNAQGEINRLEGMVTPRRMRDALASDEGKEFVTDIEEKIKVERAKL